MTKQFDFYIDISDKQLRIEGEAWHYGDEHDYLYRIDKVSLILVFENGVMMEVDVTDFLTELLHDIESSIIIKRAVEEHIERGLFTEEIY